MQVSPWRNSQRDRQVALARPGATGGPYGWFRSQSYS